MQHVGISTFQFIPCYASAIHKHAHTHTRILKPFEDSEPTGLKVDIANKPAHAVSLFLWQVFARGYLFKKKIYSTLNLHLSAACSVRNHPISCTADQLVSFFCSFFLIQCSQRHGMRSFSRGKFGSNSQRKHVATERRLPAF